MNRELPFRDPDDHFAHTKMSFGDHIEELRSHLIRAIAGFLIAMVFCFFLGLPILKFMVAPVESELGKFYDERHKKMAEKLKNDPEYQAKIKPRFELKKVRADSLVEALTKLGFQRKNDPSEELHPNLTIELIILEDPGANLLLMEEVTKRIGFKPELLRTLKVEEAFMIWMKVCVFAGFIVSSPWIFYQIWAFIAAGLYTNEKKLVNVYLPFAILLFLGGVFFAQFLVLPQTVSFLLTFNEWLGVEPELRLSDWLNFAIMVPVVFGIAFQTPLVMFLLERLGIFTVANYSKVRKLAFFLLTVIAALLAPGDLVSMIMMVLALFLFYELGIIMCRVFPKPPPEIDVEEPDEMIEV